MIAQSRDLEGSQTHTGSFHFHSLMLYKECLLKAGHGLSRVLSTVQSWLADYQLPTSINR